jgi:hypothetical protein
MEPSGCIQMLACRLDLALTPCRHRRHAVLDEPITSFQPVSAEALLQPADVSDPGAKAALPGGP